MAVNKKVVVFHCARCGSSMKRLYLTNAFGALGYIGGRFKCPCCGLLYSSSGWVGGVYSLVFYLLAAFCFLGIACFGGDKKFDLLGVGIFLSMTLMFLYMYGAFRPLTPVLHKFKSPSGRD